MKKGIDALYAMQKNGTWEAVATPGDQHDSTEGGQWGGLTGIATYALLAAGEKPTDPRIKSAVDFLDKAKLRGVYAVGVRALVWPMLPPSKAVADAARRDAALLISGMKNKGTANGMWFYYVDEPKDDRSDHSASQFALLGLWACSEAGVEIPDKFWQMEDGVWREHQQSDGGWPYVPKHDGAWGRSSLSMTCAGMASIFLTQDQLKRGNVSCSGNQKDVTLAKGFEWVASAFPRKGDFGEANPNRFLANGPNRSYYMLFGLQRLGIYSGYRYFADVDWFQSGANYLIKEQKPNGAWGETTWQSALALIFLARGRSPVAINKLNYSQNASDNPPWNQRPRDVANLTEWIGKQSEGRLNWQTVDITSDPLDWTDSPLLYLSGSEELKFSDEQKAKLRAYIEAGGLIVGNADCGSMKFATSFKKLGVSMFTSEEFRELPADHTIFNNQPYPRKKWKSKLGIQGLSNGARELMILFADADPAKAWATQNSVSKSEAFESMADIYFYVAGTSSSRFKGDTTIVKPDPAIKPTRTIAIARLQYAGNWNPEPGGWRRLAGVMHNQQKIDLDVKPVELGKGALNNSFAVAHVTGTFDLKLPDTSRSELKAFVDGGGLLVIDSAGGNGAFAAAMENELATMFPDSKPIALAPEHAAFHKPVDITKIGYRAAARRINGNADSARLTGIERNGRLAVVFSPLDLSVGLMGNNVDGINGYEPATATSLMINLLSGAKAK